MEAEYVIEQKPDYIEVRLHGVGGIQLGKEMWTAVRDKCIEAGCKKILGIGNHTVGPSTFDGFSHAELFESLGLNNSYKIAWVELGKDALESLKFIELVMNNRGLPGKLFDNVEDAMEWLLK